MQFVLSSKCLEQLASHRLWVMNERKQTVVIDQAYDS